MYIKLKDTRASIINISKAIVVNKYENNGVSTIMIKFDACDEAFVFRYSDGCKRNSDYDRIEHILTRTELKVEVEE